MISRHSSTVLSSNLARVMKREKSSLADTTAVIGCDVVRITFTADWMVECNSWTVSTVKCWNERSISNQQIISLYRALYSHLDFSKTISNVFIAAMPADKFLSLFKVSEKCFSTSAHTKKRSRGINHYFIAYYEFISKFSYLPKGFSAFGILANQIE